MTPKNSESMPETSQASSKISRSNAHQRVFLKSGTIIQRPPVLFRVPNLQNAGRPQLSSMGQNTGDKVEGLPPTSQFRRDDALDENQLVSSPHQLKSSSTTGPSAPAAMASGRDRGDTETAPSRIHESTLRIDVPRSEPISQTPDSALEKTNIASTNGDRTPSSFRFAFPADDDRVTIVHPPKSATITSASSENPNVGSHTASRTSTVEVERSTIRSTYAIPPLDPVPEGRNWMEMLGSRLMIFLVIGAIAAIAYIANQGGNFPSEATIADLKDDSQATRLSTNSASGGISSNDPAIPTLSPEANAPQSQEDSSSTRNSVLSNKPDSTPTEATAGSRRSDGSATDGNRYDQVAADQPDFDLESLLEDASPDHQSSLASPTGDSSSQGNRPSIPPNELSGNSPRVSLNSSTAVTPASTPRTPTSSASQSLTPQNRQDPMNSRVAETSQSSPNSVIRESHPTTTPNLLQGVTVPSANPAVPARNLTPEEAIRRATEAAVSGGFEGFSVPSNSTNSGAPTIDPVTGLRMTQNPLPIPDWTRYLPAPPATLNPAITPQGIRSPTATLPGQNGPNPYQNTPQLQQSAPNNYQMPGNPMPVVPGAMINPNPPTGREFNSQSSNFSAAGYGGSMTPTPPPTNSQNIPSNPYAIPPFPDSQGQNSGVGYPTYPPTLP